MPLTKAERLTIPRSLPICFLLFCAVSSLWALDSKDHISQYAHSAWRIQDGVLGGSPMVITQTADGVLWIGTNLGLQRFDGVHFTSWSPPPGERLLDPRIFSLRAAHDGGLWIGTGYSISHWQNGRLTNYPKLSGRIESIVEDADGAAWLVRTQITDGMGPLCRIKEDQARCYGAADGVPFPLALQLDKGNSGELWIRGYSELCRWKPGSSAVYFRSAAPRPETFASLRAVAVATDGSVWAAVDRSGSILQLKHFEHEKWITRSFPEIGVNNSDVTTLFVDRNDGLWIGTASHGIFRVLGNNVDHFGHFDGLSSDAVGGFYQDREGNLWVVTSDGIDNFRDLKVISYSVREGLSGAAPGSVLATRDGTIWVANSHALDLVRDGKISSIGAGQGLPGKYVTTMFEDHAGQIWVGIDNGLWNYSGGVFRPVRRSDGSGLGIVFAITEDAQHNIWVRAGPNLDRISDFRVQEEITSPQISAAYTLAASPQSGIFLGLVNGDLVHYQNGKTETFPSNETGNTRQIRDLLVEPDGSVWGTTLDEVARWKNGVRKNLTTRNGLPCDGIFALTKDDRDTLWLYSRCGLIALEKSQLDNWWEHPDSVVKFMLIDALDGVQPGLTPLKPQLQRSPDGRLWFVNGNRLQVFDPNHFPKNTSPPPIHVDGVVADRKTYSPEQNLRLPALTRDLEIDYTALSFVAPLKVHFRYILEGRDANWQDPGSRRQAFYNNLQPGSYRFRVIASNNDGIWNEAGATLGFSVAPAWYEATSFRILCVVCGLLLAWAMYQFRVKQIARAISARFDVRLAERTRIARELHDTFLQTIQGSKLVADDALENISDSARTRRALEQLSEWLDNAMQEGRAALNSLRASTTERNDLAESLRRATENGFEPDSIAVKFSVVGDVREMHPIVRDEIYRIGYEAIRNAYKHSGAKQLEVVLRYSHDLAVSVKDNGGGIEQAVLNKGKDGHFGLQGMRERAARIGGRLTVNSSAKSGTEITVVVPGQIIFRKANPTLLRRLRAMFHRTGRVSRLD